MCAKRLWVQCPSNYNETCVPLDRRTHRNIVRLCRSWIFLQLTRMKNRLRSGKQRTMSRGDDWTHVRSKLHVRRKYSICGTWRCASTPPKRKHGHAQDATQLASSESIPTKEAPATFTVRAWCVRRCATKGLNRSSRQHLHWKLYES